MHRTTCLALPAFLATLTSLAVAQTTTRDSLSSAGVQTGAAYAEISRDGRFVTFQTQAADVVPGDTNNVFDVFVRDRVTGQTSRVSVGTGGVQSNGTSLDADISADGRFVVFTSAADNLVPGDTNNTADIFCHDRQTGTTTRVSVGTGGTQVVAGGRNGTISADGRYVAFESDDNQIVAGDNCVQEDIFCHDRQTGVTSLVSISNTIGQTFTPRQNPRISDDGNFIVFDSSALDLDANDTNGWRDVWVWSRATNSVSIVSVTAAGVQGNNQSLDACISPDGRYVAFTSYATTFVPNDTNSGDIFLKDRLTGTLESCSRGLGGVVGTQYAQFSSISDDGRFVVFDSPSTNLVAGDTNAKADVFVHDRALGTTIRASVDSSGAQADGNSGVGRISGDGRRIAFHSSATNLVVPDANGSTSDIYVRDRGTTASLTFYGAGCPGTGLVVPSITNVGWPLIGNAAFGVGVAHGLASSLAIVFWNTASINVPLSGCDVLVAAPINTQPVVFLDAAGNGVAPFPIPNDPLLADLDVFFQSLVIDVNGPFLGLGALSNGLAARIGN